MFVAFSFMLAVTGCEEEKTRMVYSLKEPDNLPAEVYQVYSTLMDHQFVLHDYVVIQQETDTTTFPQMCLQMMQSDTTGLDETTINGYQRGNHFSKNLDGESFQSQVTVKLILREEFDSYESWDGFQESYSDADGLIRLSLPGFNQDTTKAVFDYTWQTDDANVQNFVVYFEYRHGQWQMDAHEPV